ncbi:MAG TPA: CHAT domain-containing protein, partial [Blastocatellia bacterium]|nr:CHAT domain-containing protein [Blastocatellia bacterium]
MNVRSQLAALILKESDSAQPDNYRARIAPLEEQAEELESELSARSAGFRVQTRPVTLDSVQTLLPAESALIEFAVYTPRDLRTRARQAPRYLAYLLTPRGSPGWVDLGEASAIDLAVEGWRKVLRVPDQTEAARMARALDEKVMGPVRARLGSEQPRRLLIAPDGLLNLIPFAALIDEQNRYLVERYTISYLTSGRDLMRLSTSNPSANAPLVLANPRFGRMETAESGSAQIFFQALPGTGQEALAIKAILPQASVLLREQATEAALKQTPAP